MTWQPTTAACCDLELRTDGTQSRLQKVGVPDCAPSPIARPRLRGGGGVDRLYGSDGNDYIHAGSGNDLVDGGLDDDMLIGADGNDNLSGNYGNDILLGGLGQDRLHGRQGDDVLLGGNDGDTVRGDAGNDLVVGGNASNVSDATTDAALQAILADWVNNNPAVPAGLGMLQLDGVQDLLIGDQGADAFHQSALPELTDEDRAYDYRPGDGDTWLP
jgi:fibronectin-binding autotransporter adhesin